jgi:hypothetical protein
MFFVISLESEVTLSAVEILQYNWPHGRANKIRFNLFKINCNKIRFNMFNRNWNKISVNMLKRNWNKIRFIMFKRNWNRIMFNLANINCNKNRINLFNRDCNINRTNRNYNKPILRFGKIPYRLEKLNLRIWRNAIKKYKCRPLIN